MNRRAIKIIHDRRNQNEVTISMDARSWEDASDAMMYCYNNRPEGYRLFAAKIVRRGMKGGRRCQLHLVLRRIDFSMPSVAATDWEEVMEPEAAISSGGSFYE